jgi:hypothetical protein
MTRLAYGLVAVLALSCSPGGGGGEETPVGGEPGTGGVIDGTGGGGAGGAGGGAGGGVGGAPEGGMVGGGEPPPPPPINNETPIEERCPDAQTGTFLLVLYPDRVDAYRQRDFNVSYFCTFLDLAGNGINDATGMVRTRDGRFLVVQTREGRGEVHAFNSNGEWEARLDSNINLAGVSGIWNTFGDDFVAHSRANQNLYKITAEGTWNGTWSPPVWQGSRLANVTDMVFVDIEEVFMTFSDRPAKLFKHPDAPDFSDEQVGPGNSITAVETDQGIKVLMTAQIGGEGNGYGVLIYKPAGGGRTHSGRSDFPPELESVLVQEADIVDGADLASFDLGFLVLDSAVGGSARISGWNDGGELQSELSLQQPGNPMQMLRALIFPDF